ncbi:hypothetical protein AVEN_176867-1 [Araneus ventricosus]|uniref:Uncharacterized protein n=2 Tax=Araneus ventricosus TaxID=182803 RepID=A0A4Y2VW22_ARAVE|nr:hypothetical protein AVEN_176867-1 [Araneus ventricosus]
MPRRNSKICANNNKNNRYESSVSQIRGSVYKEWNTPRSSRITPPEQQTFTKAQVWDNRGQNTPEYCTNIPATHQNTQINHTRVETLQTTQQKLPSSSFSNSRFHSTSLEDLNKSSSDHSKFSISELKSQWEPLTTLDPILFKAINNKIEQVEDQRFERYSKMREQSPIRYENMKENLSKFAGGIFLSEIVNSFGDDTPSIISLLNTSSSGTSPTQAITLRKRSPISSTPNCAPKSNQLTPGQVEPKEITRAEHSRNMSRTPSPILNTSTLHLAQQSPTPMDNSLPTVEITTPIFLPDASDIDGAISEMSPIPLQEINEKEDLEVLYTRLKGESGIHQSQQDPSAVYSSIHPIKEISPLHAQVEKIRETLSSLTPNVSQALLLLDQLQADILANEMIQVNPHQEAQQSSI